MFTKPLPSISLLLLLTVTSLAQVARDGPSLEQRTRELEPVIVESARRYGVDPRILRSVCFIESRYRVGAVSPKGALGPMQFMPETAARYGLKDPRDPRAAIDAAARYLHDLLVRFGGRVDLALAAYNSGEGTVESFRTGRPLMLPTGKVVNARRLVTGGIPPYPETENYVRSAMTLMSATHAIAPRAAPSQANKTLVGDKRRDFSLDAMGETEPLAIKTNRKPPSTFIDIQ